MSGDEVTQHAHCWHAETVVRLTVPPQVTVVCCHCGERQARTTEVDEAAGHGPYRPTKTVVIDGSTRRD